MIFDISPLVGAGTLKFGMASNQVRKELGVNFKSFKRTPAAEMPCDYFDSVGVFVYYRKPDVVEAIEFALPAEPIFEEHNLLQMPFKDLLELLRAKDDQLEIEVDALSSNALGIGAYAPNAEESPDLPVDSIIVFERGYYN